jgi:hypothetical protein
VSGYKLIAVIDLTIRQKLPSLHRSRSADPIVAIMNTNGAVVIGRSDLNNP